MKIVDGSKPKAVADALARQMTGGTTCLLGSVVEDDDEHRTAGAGLGGVTAFVSLPGLPGRMLVLVPLQPGRAAGERRVSLTVDGQQLSIALEPGDPLAEHVSRLRLEKAAAALRAMQLS